MPYWFAFSRKRSNHLMAMERLPSLPRSTRAIARLPKKHGCSKPAVWRAEKASSNRSLIFAICCFSFSVGMPSCSWGRVMVRLALLTSPTRVEYRYCSCSFPPALSTKLASSEPSPGGKWNLAVNFEGMKALKVVNSVVTVPGAFTTYTSLMTSEAMCSRAFETSRSLALSKVLQSIWSRLQPARSTITTHFTMRLWTQLICSSCRQRSTTAERVNLTQKSQSSSSRMPYLSRSMTGMY
mmetsp:Transcript_40290/g.125695  ORF Transcript_40290/g.125695 Transcript_40290/m.125695 type:complete len:239 (-) Transcript_40290:361-1077(-)